MEACKLSLHVREVHNIPGMRSRSGALSQRQTTTATTTANSSVHCSCRITTSPKLRLSSSFPRFRKFASSPQRSFSTDGLVTERRTSTNVMTTLDSEVKTEGDESKLLESIRNALKLDSFTLSAYDTAWVAMIPNDMNDGPLYPQTLKWISSNQLQDGSWGDDSHVIPFDFILSTLACLVALNTWNMASECNIRGETFLENALNSMKEDDLELMSPGLFHALAELLEESSRIGISLPYSSPIVKHLRTNHSQLLDSLSGISDLTKICARRLLSFPEGLQRVISWTEMSELQSEEGDLFSSPAATACLVMRTRDTKALGYLNHLLEQFGSAAPNQYPKRLSHVLSLVDHLERLNVDRNFHKEIYEILDTLSRRWNLKTDEETQDTVTEIMSFRFLREHSYNVLPETSVFAKCCNGSAEVEKLGHSFMLELYRASELMFPGEEVLDYARDISTTYLNTLLLETLEHDQTNVNEEIKNLFEFPIFLRNPCVESLRYMNRFQFNEQNNETYVETRFSRITHACNPQLLAFAKCSFNSCQALYQKELQALARWREKYRFTEVSFMRQQFHPSYLTSLGFTSAPELALARTSWTMNSVLTTAVDDLFDETSDLSELRLFVECVRRWDLSIVESCDESLKILAWGLLSSADYLCKEASRVQGYDLSYFFRATWLDVAVSMMTEAEWTASGYKPTFDEYMETGYMSFAMGPMVPLGVFFLGQGISDEDLKNPEYWNVFRTGSTFGRLLNDSRTHERDTEGGHASVVSVYMREHPELTAEEAKKLIIDMVNESASKLLFFLLNPSYSCPPIKSGCLSMMRALCMVYYKNVDGFSTTPEELKKNIERVLFQPFPANTLRTP